MRSLEIICSKAKPTQHQSRFISPARAVINNINLNVYGRWADDENDVLSTFSIHTIPCVSCHAQAHSPSMKMPFNFQMLFSFQNPELENNENDEKMNRKKNVSRIDSTA